MEALCSPADTCLLARRDVMSFLRDVQSGSLGPNDKKHIDQLVSLIEDTLGFQIFESIEQAKRELSSQRRDASSVSTIRASKSKRTSPAQEFTSFCESAVAAILAKPRRDAGAERRRGRADRPRVLHRGNGAGDGDRVGRSSNVSVPTRSYDFEVCTRSSRAWRRGLQAYA